SAGQTMTPDEVQQYNSLEEEMKVLTPGGDNPIPPSKFDWVFQWACILSLPCVPYFLILIIKAKKQVYRLDDEGALHLPENEGGTWLAQDIVDIDMSRWMKKSIAHVVHTDNRKAKLDDYIHQDMAKIVGTLAHRFHPELWDEEARQIKKDGAQSGEASSQDHEAEITPDEGETGNKTDSNPDI
ncbi:MAG: hypothetical protein O7G85_17000, partial [Planctomycetota bacterium]|nr:hypothetical protein [Planctomycetota bacterium]